MAYTKQTEKGAFNGWGDANGARERDWELLDEDEGLAEAPAAAPAAASETPRGGAKSKSKAHGTVSPRGKSHGSESPRAAKGGAKPHGHGLGHGHKAAKGAALDSRRKV